VLRPALGSAITNTRGSSPEASISNTTLRSRSLVQRSLYRLYRLVLHSLYSLELRSLRNPVLRSLRNPVLRSLRNLDEQLYRRVAMFQSFPCRSRCHHQKLRRAAFPSGKGRGPLIESSATLPPYLLTNKLTP